MVSTCSRQRNATKPSTEYLLALNSRRGAGPTRRGALRIAVSSGVQLEGVQDGVICYV